MGKINTTLHRELLAKAEISAKDTDYINQLNDAYTDAMRISDGIDRYEALKKLCDRKHEDYFQKRRGDMTSSLSGNMLKAVVFGWAGGISAAVLIGIYTPIHHTLFPLIGFFISHPTCMGITAALIRHSGKKKYADAFSALEKNLKGPIEEIFKSAEASLEKTRKDSRAVQEFCKHDYFDSDEIKEKIKTSIRSEFNQGAHVAPETLTVTIDSTAKKPSIRLKKEG